MIEMELPETSFDGWDSLTVDERPEVSIRSYIINRLTREYLHNIYDRSPDLHQQILKLIADDQFAKRHYFKQENIKVEDQPSQVDNLYLNWQYWCKGRTGMVGGTRSTLKKDIKRNLLFYMGKLGE